MNSGLVGEQGARLSPAGLVRTLRWWSGSLAGRLVFFAVVLVSGTAVLIGALAYNRARHALEDHAKTTLALMARDIAGDLAHELTDAAADVINWSRLEPSAGLREAQAQARVDEFFRQVLEGHRTYRGIVAVDPDGSVLAAYGRYVLPSPRQMTEPARMSIVRPPEDGGDAMLLVEAPVHVSEGDPSVIGTFALLVDPAAAVSKVSAVAVDPARGFAVTLREVGGDPIAVAGAWPQADVRTIGDRGWVSGHSRVASMSGVTLPSFEIVVSEPRASALAPVLALRREVVQTGILALLLSCLLGALVAWLIARPIRRLTANVQAIGDTGSLDAQIQLSAERGEVGVLTSAFRAMLASLSEAQAQSLAQSRLALLGEVAANIAHEVRTPLSVMKTSAQLLARPETPPGERDRLAVMISDEVDRLNTVVTDLVDIARPKPVVYKAEPLAPIVTRAAVLFDGLASRSRIVIRRDIHGRGSNVRCSADQIYQVMLNLLRNAMQAIGSDGTITVRVRENGAWVHVEVEDDGPGFAAATLEKAFSPFVTTKPGGAGLGLAIAERIVEEHGGSIAAENVDGRGARVIVRLPLGGAA